MLSGIEGCVSHTPSRRDVDPGFSSLLAASSLSVRADVSVAAGRFDLREPSSHEDGGELNVVRVCVAVTVPVQTCADFSHDRGSGPHALIAPRLTNTPYQVPTVDLVDWLFGEAFAL